MLESLWKGRSGGVSVDKGREVVCRWTDNYRVLSGAVRSFPTRDRLHLQDEGGLR